MTINQYTEIFNQEKVDKIWEYLTKPNWEFWHVSNAGSKNFFWYMNLENNSFFTQDLFSNIKKLIGDEFSIQRVYANGQTFGLDGEFHIDDPDDDAYTFLYYPAKNWNFSWGGETVILEPNGLINNIHPIPNTGIMFPSNWVHCGKAPSKKYTDLRVTIAYKLKK